MLHFLIWDGLNCLVLFLQNTKSEIKKKKPEEIHTVIVESVPHNENKHIFNTNVMFI